MFITSFTTQISQILENAYTMRCILLGVEMCVFIFKGYLLYAFTTQIGRTKTLPRAWFFLLIALGCLLFEDFTWICSLSRRTWAPHADYRIILFLVRIGWSLNLIMYQAIALFLESFVQKDSISFHQKILSCISGISAVLVFGFSILYFNVTDIAIRPTFEFIFFKFETIYGTFAIIPLALFYTWIQIKKSPSQKILKKQLLSFSHLIVIPYILLNIWLTFSFDPKTDTQSILAQAGSVIFIALALYYTLKKIIHIRFLNIHTHVRAQHSFNFVHDFKTILDNLSSATSINEMKLLTQRFFNQAFALPMGCVYLKMRNETDPSLDDTTHATVERFISTIHVESSLEHPEKQYLRSYLKNNRILVFDEIEFDHYHQTNEAKTIILEFLSAINADLFIPIYEQNSIIAYIAIERFARPEKLYSDAECDEMIVFANYLAKIINLLQNRNLTEMLKQRKEILEELYSKHQEINQYKESIRSFLKNHESGSGIILYKNKRFNLINKEACSLLAIDPNKDEGHPLTKQLHRITQQTFLYQNNHTETGVNGNKKKIIISSTHLTDYNALLITINYPEIYDTIKAQIDNIKDPSNWDYLLYLETTQTGMLINQLVPGNGEMLLNFKIELLKLSLSKKAVLIDLPEDDLQSIVEILHHINLREQLHTLELTSHINQGTVAISLFGINPLYGRNTTIPLLEKLDKTGTLFIKNIHLLDLETQETLAQFIKYGFYHAYKSQKLIQHDVRIICSSHANLARMVQEKTFSTTLFNELKKASLTMPSLLTLPLAEMNQLVEGFAQQAVVDSDASNFLTLSHTDHTKIENQRPVSLHELKLRTQQLLVNKSKKQDMYEEELFNQSYTITDPQLAEISRLGKSALKDPKTMHLLWNKFKNQNKIALFLGVNRSSINRRFKEYNIQ